MRWLPVVVMLAVLHAGCASKHRTPLAPRAPASERTVAVEGHRWVITNDVELPLLRPGVRLLGLVRVEDLGGAPRRETVFVRASDGRIVGIHHAADLQPFLAPITTPAEALNYVKFLRVFPIPQSEAPGLVRGSPERSGVSPEIMDEGLQEEGIDPTPAVTTVPGGFELVRLVILRDTGEPARLVRIRERVGTDGAYSAQILETVPTKARVEDWIWDAC